MLNIIRRKSFPAATLFGAVLLTALFLGSTATPKASASVTGFCENVTLGGYKTCLGSYRKFEAILAWGDQHSVCVEATTPKAGQRTCSGGPGASTYNTSMACGGYYPSLENNANGSNTVHGVTYDCTPAEHGNARRYMLGTSNGSNIGSWTTALDKMGPSDGLAAGDVNGDGKADVVAIEDESNLNDKKRYMLGTSTGSGLSWNFTNLTGMTSPDGNSAAEGFAVGDVNGDKKADIVAAEREASGKTRYMVGISDGMNFSWKYTNLSNMVPPRQIALGDINADGKADIIATEKYGSYYTYVQGISTGDGTTYSWSGTNLTGMWTPYKMGLGDVDGDGKADIIAAEATNNNPAGGTYEYKVGIRNATGFTWQNTNLVNMWEPRKMGIGDVNADGKADIVALEKNPGTGVFDYAFGVRNGSSFTWGGAIGNLLWQLQTAVGDFSGDGKADVVSLEEYAF